MVVDPELIVRYQRLYSPLVSDCIDVLGLGSRVLAAGLRPFHRDTLRVVVGPAHTCQMVTTDVPEDLNVDLLLEVLDATPAGAVTVSAAEGQPPFATWGGLMSAGTQSHGGVGAVVNGAVRDLKQITDLDFPVWAPYSTPLDIRGRGQVTGYGVAVECRGVTIQPGEIVVADANGVVVVPAGHELAVLELCEEKLQAELRTGEDIAAGATMREVYERHGAI